MDGITITPMDAKTAPEAELRRLNDFVNGLNHEAWPDDAPSSFEAFKTSIDTAPHSTAHSAGSPSAAPTSSPTPGPATRSARTISISSAAM